MSTPRNRRPSSRRLVVTALAALLLGVAPGPGSAQTAALPTPEDHFGFAMGTEGELARWDGILEYYTALAAGTDRMRVDTLGTSVLGNPFVAVTITSPANFARLDEIRAASEALGEGRISEDEARRISRDIPASVLIHHNIHSTEIGASQTSVELVHRLVAAAPGSLEAEVLDEVVTVLIPSGNPDGQIMVTDWWYRVKGTDWEESGMPYLYHHYAGHDNNRDFFQAALPETRHWMELMFETVHPQIYLDQHQMGSSGPRIFVPPYPDPMDPKVHPLQWQSLQFIGGGMVTDLQAEGKQGVISGEMYRIWGQEGALTGRHHNVVSILTETASSNLAGPVEVSRERLERSRSTMRGEDPYGFSIAFPDPWWGGEWTLQDIVDYQMISAMSVLTQAARFHDLYLFRRWQMAAETIERAAEEGPWAYVVPIEGQHDPVAATDMVRRLALQGIEVHRAVEAFEAVPGVEPIPNSLTPRQAADGVTRRSQLESERTDRAAARAGDDGDDLDAAAADGAGGEPRTFAAGSWVIRLDQNARAAILDLLEVQDREIVREYPGGPWRRSYDGAAYTMPMQMGVEAVRIDAPVDVALEVVERVSPPMPGLPEARSTFWLDAAVTASYAAVNELLAAGVPVERFDHGFRVASGSAPAREILARHHGANGLPVRADVNDGGSGTPMTRTRIGLYQGWTNSMDEGWTRLLLDEYGFDYEVLRGPDVAAGDLLARFDAIVIPGQMSVSGIVDGRDAEDVPEEFAGGIGEEGVDALRAFVRAGGHLVTLDSSDRFAIEHFGVPVEDATSGHSEDELFQPSSIYRLELVDDHLLTRGSPSSVAAKWAGGRAWTPTGFGGEGDLGRIRVVGHWPEDPDEVLMSGTLLGADRLAGKAAILDVEYGAGRIWMYGFRVQHRMQTTGTFKLLLNALQAPAGRPITE